MLSENEGSHKECEISRYHKDSVKKKRNRTSKKMQMYGRCRKRADEI